MLAQSQYEIAGHHHKFLSLEILEIDARDSSSYRVRTTSQHTDIQTLYCTRVPSTVIEHSTTQYSRLRTVLLVLSICIGDTSTECTVF